jgi:hypothetical protein
MSFSFLVLTLWFSGEGARVPGNPEFGRGVSKVWSNVSVSLIDDNVLHTLLNFFQNMIKTF